MIRSNTMAGENGVFDVITIMKCKSSCLVVAAAALILAPLSSHALILFGSQDPDFNTTPPTGEYANSGWDMEGQWLAVMGTPVSPRYFVAAKHVGGWVGASFKFRNVTYTTIARIDHPTDDLTLWKINGTFPTFARIYQGTNVTGLTAAVFGRGSMATNAVYTIAPKTGEYGLRGWYVGSIDGRMRWGLSKSVSLTDDGTEIVMSFDQDSGPNQCIAEFGDSSGGIFLKQEGQWKIAGLINATDGLFSLATNGPYFQAALFDLRGVYYPDLRGGKSGDGTWENDGNPIPAHSYGVFLPTYGNWISTNAGIVTLERARIVNSQCVLDISSAATASVSVQTSTNLVDWRTLGEATHVSGGSFQYTDTNAISATPRFFRAVASY
jgi:hypothetical protein